jgi:hypothetical protein
MAAILATHNGVGNGVIPAEILLIILISLVLNIAIIFIASKVLIRRTTADRMDSIAAHIDSNEKQMDVLDVRFDQSRQESEVLREQKQDLEHAIDSLSDPSKGNP